MNEYLYLNKISFLAQREKRVSYLFWISIFFSITILGSCIIEVRFSYKTTAVYNLERNTLQIYWDDENLNQLNQIESVKVDEKEFSFQILNVSELKINELNQTNYQIVDIFSPQKYQENQMIYIKLLDKKEKIIKKLKKIMLGE